MKRNLLLATALGFMLATGPVLAAGVAVNLSATEQAQIKQDILGAKVEAMPQADFDLKVGTVIPKKVTLHKLPATVIKLVPSYSEDEFFQLADGRIIIVDPTSMKIIAVLS